MTSSLPTCVSCGYVLPKSNLKIPCPNCGTQPRMVQATAHPKKPLKLSFRQRWPGFLGWVADSINRVQWSLRRIFSREILIFDLSRPGRTTTPQRPKEAPVLHFVETQVHPGLGDTEEIVLRPCPTDFTILTSASGHNGNGSANGEQKPFPETPFRRRIPNC
jgi:hypothetical protein